MLVYYIPTYCNNDFVRLRFVNQFVLLSTAEPHSLYDDGHLGAAPRDRFSGVIFSSAIEAVAKFQY